jgi:hypothetical protein
MGYSAKSREVRPIVMWAETISFRTIRDVAREVQCSYDFALAENGSEDIWAWVYRSNPRLAF